MPVDSALPEAASYTLVPGRSVTLRQANRMGPGSHKYYVIQALRHRATGEYFFWAHWGRVGAAPGQVMLKNMGLDVTAVIEAFEKKFSDKTANLWSNRDNMTAVDGKYTIVSVDAGAAEVDQEDDDGDACSLPGTVVEEPAAAAAAAAVCPAGAEEDESGLLAKD